jgi:hypothetical protein
MSHNSYKHFVQCLEYWWRISLLKNQECLHKVLILMIMWGVRNLKNSDVSSCSLIFQNVKAIWTLVLYFQFFPNILVMMKEHNISHVIAGLENKFKPVLGSYQLFKITAHSGSRSFKKEESSRFFFFPQFEYSTWFFSVFLLFIRFSHKQLSLHLY